MKICTIGDLCADLILPYGEAKADVRNQRTGRKHELTFRPGGQVGNTSVVLARIGEHPYFVTDLCSDPIGQNLKQQLSEAGVDFSWSRVNPDKANMICLAVVEDNDQIIFPWLPPGSGYPEFSRENLSLVPRENMMVFSGGMIMTDSFSSIEAVLSLLEELKAAGSVIVFDLNARAETYGMNRERKQAFARAVELSDYLLGSGAAEFASVCGIHDLHEAACFLSNGKRTVIARDGHRPVLVVENGRTAAVPTVPVKVTGTIGAGDTFNAAFLHALNQGADAVKSVRFANRIAGYMISHPGHLSLPENAGEILRQCME